METILEQKRSAQDVINEAESIIKYLSLAESVAETSQEISDYNQMYSRFEKILKEINAREDSEFILSKLGISLDTPIEFKQK